MNPPDIDHLDPWFDDGNIVLAAEGKAFRVHRGVMSSFSGVFRDMFACPHSDNAETELIEGCPVIHLHDAATDVQVILRALYDSRYMYPCCEKMPFPVFAAFLRLGKKYDIPHLFSKAEERVRPSTKPDIFNLSLTPPTPGRNLCAGIIPSDPYNIQLMNLLREMELIAYLPVLMYQAALTSPIHPFINGHEIDGVVCSLSPPNLRSYVLITDILKRLSTRLMKSLASARGNCTQWSCAQNSYRVWCDSEQQPFGLGRLEWDNWFCASCKPNVQSMRETVVGEAWEELPKAFDFDSWDDVKKVVKYGQVPVCRREL